MMAAEAFAMTDLKDLDPLAKRLNAATDEFTKVLETIQQKLNALSLGVEAWLDQYPEHELGEEVSNVWMELDGVPVSSYSEDDAEGLVVRRSRQVQELGYGRLGDGWALIVRTMNYPQIKTADGWRGEDGENPTEVERKPLLRSSRQIRVKTVDLMSLLINRLQEEAERVINAIEKAKKIAESLK